MGNVHMAYRSDSGFPDRLTYTKVTREGAVLIDNQFLGTGAIPTFVVDRSQYIHMVYGDPDGPGTSVEYLKLAQDGTVLIGPLTLSIHESNITAHMALDSLQYLHVVWQFIEGDTNGIMYTKIDTLGNTIIPPMAIVYPPHTPGAGLPRIEVDRSNRLHLVFMDGRLGGEDIYYKRGENEQTVEEWSTNILQDQYYLSVSPNPFRDATRIRIGCPDGFTHSSTEANKNTPLTLRIYDVTGRVVKWFSVPTAYDTISAAVWWDGTNQSNRKVPIGVYYIVLKNSSNIITKKVVKLQ